MSVGGLGADLGVICVAGLGTPPHLLGFHPVALHGGVMFTAVKENRALAADDCNCVSFDLFLTPNAKVVKCLNRKPDVSAASLKKTYQPKYKRMMEELFTVIHFLSRI